MLKYFSAIGNNCVMKRETLVKYGANADERESYLPPEVCPRETDVDNSVRKEKL